MRAGTDETELQVSVPVTRIIHRAADIFRTHQTFSDATPRDVVECLERCLKACTYPGKSRPLPAMEMLLRAMLHPAVILRKHRLSQKALEWMHREVERKFLESLANAGEMVGVVSAQSMGEPATQMSVLRDEKMRIISVEKSSNEYKCQNVEIGDFCDKLIEKFPETTKGTGFKDSVETELTGNTEYYIVGVDSNENTRWNRISHISRHPVNGQIVRVKTRSGRSVVTTASHSHLTRDAITQTVVPIRADKLSIGQRVPVIRSIENIHTMSQYKFDSMVYDLDEIFGWFVGA